MSVGQAYAAYALERRWRFQAQDFEAGAGPSRWVFMAGPEDVPLTNQIVPLLRATAKRQGAKLQSPAHCKRQEKNHAKCPKEKKK